MTKVKYLYRFIDEVDHRKSDEEKTYFKATLKSYFVEKKTECGFWINILSLCDSRKNSRKWVSKKGKSIFAYQTEELALNAYVFRKESQISHLKYRLKQAERMFRISKRFFYYKYKYEYDIDVDYSLYNDWY